MCSIEVESNVVDVIKNLHPLYYFDILITRHV